MLPWYLNFCFLAHYCVTEACVSVNFLVLKGL